LDTIQGLKLRF